MGFFMQLRCVVCILLVVVCFKENAGVNLPPNVSIPAVFGFGDSIIDTGNNNILATLFKCTFPPYGCDFPGGIPTGRFSNGKVPSDLIGTYIWSVISYFYEQGVYSLNSQLDFFSNYLQSLRRLVGDDKTNFILANSIFLVVSSSNDISTTFYGRHPPTADINEYATFLIKGAFDFLKEIYNQGARRIAVFSAPPIGCLPFIRFRYGGPNKECVGGINQGSMNFNDKLSALIDSLKQNLTNIKIAYIDIYNPLMSIINGTDHDGGFNVVDRGCCGSGSYEAGYLCNQWVSLCPNHTEYMFWDSFHPTEALYKYVLPPALQKYIDENLK